MKIIPKNFFIFSVLFSFANILPTNLCPRYATRSKDEASPKVNPAKYTKPINGEAGNTVAKINK